ncbi:unnamed protein product [Tenebrio molitor]|nr:unnamed protein product [Tenebrio molitor]
MSQRENHFINKRRLGNRYNSRPCQFHVNFLLPTETVIVAHPDLAHVKSEIYPSSSKIF